VTTAVTGSGRCQPAATAAATAAEALGLAASKEIPLLVSAEAVANAAGLPSVRSHNVLFEVLWGLQIERAP